MRFAASRAKASNRRHWRCGAAERVVAFGIPLNELAWLAAAILIGGLVTGILAGLFGIGGGAVIVPVLYEVFRVLEVPEPVRMQLCVGTSLAIIIPTTLRSYRTHRAKGMVREDVVRLLSAPAVAGVAIGSLLAAFAPAAVFKIVFVLFATGVALKLLFATEGWQIAERLPGRTAMSIYGGLVGLCSSLTGVSGGSISNVILTLYGVPIHNAVAISAGMGVPITIAGAIGYALAGWPHMALLPPLSIGFVSLIGFAVMAPVSSLTASYGASLAHALRPRQLEIAFGAYLLLVAARFVASLIW
jgi:uncharacterized membrane protein YfcA